MKFQRFKLVRIEYNRLFFPNWQVSIPVCYLEPKSFLFAVGHLQLKGRMVLETGPLLSQRNNTEWSENYITCFFSSLSLCESCRSSVLISGCKTYYCFIFGSLYILTCCRSVSSWSIHKIIDILRWHAERMLCRQGTANDKPLGCYVNCNFLCRYVFLSRGEKNRPYTFKKFNRELLFKGFQELRIHHLAIGINESYCSLKNTLYI